VDRAPTAYTRCYSRPLESYFDGSLKLGGAGVGVLFISLDRK
jgi:hypothetical protein